MFDFAQWVRKAFHSDACFNLRPRLTRRRRRCYGWSSSKTESFPPSLPSEAASKAELKLRIQEALGCVACSRWR
jgi:hypothetical protein